jgi:hypothetical protein
MALNECCQELPLGIGFEGGLQSRGPENEPGEFEMVVNQSAGSATANALVFGAEELAQDQ